MGRKKDAVAFVLKDALGPVRRTPDARDLGDFMLTGLKWVFPVLAPAIAGFAQYYIPGTKVIYPWAIPLGVFVLSLAVLVYLSAVWQRLRVVDLEQASKPRLVIEKGKQESTGQIRFGWGLLVHNAGDDEAIDVHAELEAIQFACPTEGISLDEWPTNRPLHWAAQGEDDAFAIPGQQARRLNICYFNENTLSVELSYHRSSNEFRTRNALTFDKYPVHVLVNIVCRGQKPLFALCRIDPYPYERSFDLLYWGVERPDLSQYEEEPPAEATTQ